MALWVALICALFVSGTARAQRVKPVVIRSTPVRVSPILIPRVLTPALSGSARLMLAPQVKPTLPLLSISPELYMAEPMGHVFPAIVPEPLGVREGLAAEVSRIEKARTLDAAGGGVGEGLDEFYQGAGRRGGVTAGGGASAGSIINDEGVRVFERAAAYYREIREVVSRLQGRVDLAESLDVMDDTYSEVWGKLKAVEAIAKSRGIEQENTHLERTLTWVDGVLRQGGKTIAVHTHRVYLAHGTELWATVQGRN